MGKTKRLSIPVSGETKYEWEKHEKSQDLTESLSHMVRLYVNREIARQEDTGSTYPERATATEGIDPESISEIASGIQSIQNRIGDMDERMTVLETGMNDVRSESMSTGDLQRSVFELLPSPDDFNGTPDEWGITAGRVADTLGRDPERVTDVLETLRETTSRVRSGYVDERNSAGPNTFFWKQGGEGGYAE